MNFRRSTEQPTSVTEEVVFGYKPTSSRMTMMNNADDDGDDVLSDDDSVERVTLRDVKSVIRREIEEIVRKIGNKWVLYSKHKKNGKRRRLGTHSSKKGAYEQEKAIKAHGG